MRRSSARSGRPFPSRGPVAGLTLVEVLVAGSLGALLLISLASATGSLFDMYRVGRDETLRCREGAHLLDRLSACIRESVDASVEDGALVFEDASGEVTRFDWSGVAGDPLTVQEEGGDTFDLAGAVQSLTVTITNRNEEVEELTAEERQICYFDQFSISSTWKYISLNSQAICGEIFTVPGDAPVEGIVLTQVGARLGRSGGLTGDVRISLEEVYTEGYPRPHSPRIASVVIPNSSIPYLDYPNIYWGTFDLTEDFRVHAGRTYCMLFQSDGTAPAAVMRYRFIEIAYFATTGDLYNDLKPIYSYNDGANWLPDLASSDLLTIEFPFSLTAEYTTRTTTTTEVPDRIVIELVLAGDEEDLHLRIDERLRGGF